MPSTSTVRARRERAYNPPGCDEEVIVSPACFRYQGRMLRSLLLAVAVAFAMTSMPPAAEAAPSKWSMKSASKTKAKTRAKRRAVARKSVKSKRPKARPKAKSKPAKLEKRPMLI